jgi:hypothetical protein
VTTANPQHAQPGRLSQAWRRFRRWRRTRPFWGGLFTALAGLEIFSTTQMSLGGLTFHMGPTGFLSWLIPTILVACGMLMWFTPQQRMFYAIVGAVTAVFSLIGVNLGGFFIGLLLGMVGGALGFAWVPDRSLPKSSGADEPEPAGGPTASGEEPGGEPALVDDLTPADKETNPLTDTVPQPRGPLREPLPADDASAQASPAGAGRPGGTHRNPRVLAVTLVLLSVSAVGALALRDQTPVRAAAPTPCPTPSSTRTATPSPSAPESSASASPSPSPTRSSGGLLGGILDGIRDLLGGGDKDASTSGGDAETSPEPEASPTATPTPGDRPGTDDPACGPTPAPTKPGKPGEVEPGKPLPQIAPDPGQPRVAAKPSKLTGSKVTMTGLRFAGIVELPTAEGTLRALKFTMSKAVTDDFLLRVDGPGGKTVRYATDRLTVERAERDVAFYTTRFSGRLAGIKITLTPNLPFPDGIPVTFPIPVTFTDPEIDLAYVDSDILTAKPTLTVDLA